MKKYRVNVNGTSYEVEIEEITAGEAASVTPAQKSAPAPAAAASSAAQTPAGAETVTAPMPGNILSVNVKNGDNVKAGQVLMILEAMKMENEILAPCDGKASGVAVSAGQTVETGAILCTIG